MAKTEPGSFQQCPVAGPETVATKSKKDLSSEHQKTLQYHEGDKALTLVAQGACGFSILGEKERTKKPSDPEKPVLDGSF